ncbi:hypothetical protein RugamoR64_19200 [Duganella rhizosphaerae]|uniref:hypothetical protein n=1 Tax=Duganella rhizosphaerae TaxID=2885763 RepID=UPI0030E879E7
MKLKFHGISALPFLIAAWSNAYAEADAKSTTCPVKNKVSEPTIYLIDKDSKLVKGPVDFGTFVTKENFASDYLVKDTQYRAILFPARLEIVGEECNICISVKKIAPICPNSSTFSVGVGMVFKGLPGAVSPYKVDDPFEFRFVDKKMGVDPQVKLEFDARIVGVLVKSK